MLSRLVLLLAAFSLGASAYAGGVFWTDRGVSQLKRMNFDGTGLQVIALSGAVTSAGGNIRGIAVDVPHNWIFWADNGADQLLRANMDGSGSVVLYTVPGGSSFPADVRLDLAGGLFFWCDQLRNRIQSSTFDGLNVTDVITNAAGTGPYFMDLDRAAGKIYWGDFDAGSIFRADLDGSNRETLLTGNNRTRGVCVDPGGGMLYWINRDDKKVHRCPLSAFTNGTIGLTNPVVQTLYTGLDTPHGLVLDLPARKLYWADTGTNPGIGTGEKAVNRGDLDGSTPQEVLAIGTEPWDVDLDRRCATYSEWRQRCFRRDAPSEQTDPAADPDGDSIINLLEYAFDLAPMGADRSALPVGFETTGPSLSGKYHGIKYRRRADASDLIYTVQVSTDLVTWRGSASDPQTVETGVISLGDGMEEVTARTLYTVNGLPTHFMRVSVSVK